MQQIPVGPSSSSSSTVFQFSTIPQFVVIHNQMQQSWKHLVVHYIFEDEHFPFNVPKERCVLVNLNDDGESVADCHSLSHNFQVTNCKISLIPQMTASEQGKESSTTTGLIKSSKIRGNKFGIREEFEQSSSIFGLDELIPVGPSSSSSSTVFQFSTIPQFVVIHNQMQQSWKHLVVHYIFEDEHFPFNVPKERCVLVNLNDDGESVADCHSLSHNFQVTNCKISLIPQMTASEQGKESSTTTGLIKSSKIRGNKFGIREEFEQSSSIFGLDELNLQQISSEFLNELIVNFHCRDRYVLPILSITQDLKTKKYTIVLRYMKNGNLKNFFQQNKTLPWKKWLWLLNSFIRELKTIQNPELKVTIFNGYRPKTNKGTSQWYVKLIDAAKVINYRSRFGNYSFEEYLSNILMMFGAVDKLHKLFGTRSSEDIYKFL
ncbi:hypothetical protein Glove_386g39 [Diversispora epigaea]|uniref:Protein kinase domain-containing protein n=1 Tax=Diversispora epigaea TaxID=1348612 RepID=A0A397H356_9GLOM|nr:hypothetical protein Glove_386g39 [Diversispora epigaea]